MFTIDKSVGWTMNYFPKQNTPASPRLIPPHTIGKGYLVSLLQIETGTEPIQKCKRPKAKCKPQAR